MCPSHGGECLEEYPSDGVPKRCADLSFGGCGLVLLAMLVCR